MDNFTQRGNRAKGTSDDVVVASTETNGVHTPHVRFGAGAVTDRSGTITLGGTAQQLVAANTARRYLLIQNISAGDLWINDAGTAAIGGPGSLKIVAGGYYEYPASFVTSGAISIIGATTAQAFTAKEG